MLIGRAALTMRHPQRWAAVCFEMARELDEKYYWWGESV